MSKQSIERALHAAVAHHQAGRFAQAEPIYRQVLAVDPRNADALHLLGLLSGQTGRHDVAVDFFRKAIVQSPRNPVYHCNLGYSLLQISQEEAATAAFQSAVSLQTENAEAYFIVGGAHLMKGALEPAIACYQRALAYRPDYFDALLNLGHALVTNKQPDLAISICQRAVAINAGNSGAHINLGNALKGAGRFDEAIVSYQRAIAIEPNYAVAHNNLGNALQDTKQYVLAAESFQAAIKLNPGRADFHRNLGAALLGIKQWDLAISTLTYALEREPDDAIALHNLAKAWTAKKERSKALECLERALLVKPDYVDALLTMAEIHSQIDQKQHAMDCIASALRIKPDFADAYNVRGVIQCKFGDLTNAIMSHQHALELKPDFLEAHHNLANAFKEKGQLEEAIESYKKALELAPNHVKILSSLGAAWKEGNQLDMALACYQRALAIDADDTDALAGIGSVLQDMGQLKAAIKCYRRVIELDPAREDIHQSLLFGLLYEEMDHPLITTEEHRRWGRLHADPFARFIKPLQNLSDPDRKLRIGYVSGDFREHSVTHFMEPLLRAHDKVRFDIYCYANVRKTDAVTERLKSYVTQWRDILALNDEEAADVVRNDKIDILVELSGHTAHQRLLLFARKPAPVQVNYLGYPATTGISAIDYRITDMLSDPPGMTDNHCVETMVRLPTTNWVYQPPADAPEVALSPSSSSHIVTFGSLNYFGKLSDIILDSYMRILSMTPNSRLLIKSKGLGSNGSRGRVRQFMDMHHIPAEQVEFIEWIPPAEHYRHFGRLDIALDSFPYNGTTTTCESLWMGVPVVTLAGKSHVSRVGASLLTNMGLPELVAETADEFVQIAAGLASDLPRLAGLRSSIRERMRKSPIMDEASLACEMESAYRTMWRKWCEQRAVSVGG